MRRSILAFSAVFFALSASAPAGYAREDDLMKQGMDLLYAKADFPRAEELFRKVLKEHPRHYGATYQLATALERQKKIKEAAALWGQVLDMAMDFSDAGSAETARARVPGVSMVLVKTALGPFKILIDGRKAPKSADNFLKYVDEKFYDGTIFHRIYGGFFVQGGGLDPGRSPRPKARGPVKSEAGNGLHNRRGSVGMARADDPDGADVQFYVNVVDNSGWMDKTATNPGYTVFGFVTEGMEVVDWISKAPVDGNGSPKVPIVMESIARVP